jgi:ABC-type transport system substrate-binding protein
MQRKWIILLSVIMVLVPLLLTESPLAAVASKGELTVVAPKYGLDIHIPAYEQAQAKDILKLLYDPLVGSTPDGDLSPDYGIAYKWEKSPDARTWTFYLKGLSSTTASN